MPRWLSRFAMLLAAVLTAVLVPVPVPALAAGVDYVALGDSYSSGVGASGVSGTCVRSQRSYAPLWAAANDATTFRFPACSGATTDDVRADQLSSLGAGTDLVSITIGGNDAGFAATVGSCVLGTDSFCTSAVASARRYITRTLPGRLDATYAAIRQRAPNATVVVLGYPRLFEATPTCGIAGLSLTKRRAMNAAADDLSAVTEARAAAAGFRYADVRDEFAGHGICAATPWINRLNLLNVVASYHPTNSGYASGYLPALTGAAG